MLEPYVAGSGPVGVLVLSGSSGRVEVERCDMLAAALAVTALCPGEHSLGLLG